MNVLPWPGRLFTSIVPPCAWAMASALGRPSPTPSCGVARVVAPDVEPLEQVRLIVAGDAGSIVGHGPANRAVCRAFESHRDPPSVRREVLRIGGEVQQRPIEARAIAEHARSGTARDVQFDRLATPIRERTDGRDSGLGELGRVELAKLEPDRPGSVAGEVEDLADEVLHPLGISLHRLEHRAALLGGRVGRWVEQQSP